MSKELERNALISAYKGANGKVSQAWVTKVNKMSESQVAAVYLRLKAQKKI